MAVFFAVLALPISSVFAGQKDDPDTYWRVRIVPMEGRPYVTHFSEIHPDGVVTIPGVDPDHAVGENAETKLVSWLDIRSVSLVPKLRWGQDIDTWMVIDDDGRSRVTSNFGKIKLRKGLHRFELGYAHTAGTGGDKKVLQLDYKAPGSSSWAEVPATMLKRQQDWRWPVETMSTGLDDDGFRLPDKPRDIEDGPKMRLLTWHEFSDAPEYLEDLRQIPLARYSGASKISPPSLERASIDSESVAALFEGLLDIPEDGEYRFRLKSDGLSCLIVGHRSALIQERTFPFRDDCWDVSLGYGGRITAPFQSLEDNIVRFPIRHGPSRDNPEVVEVPIHRRLIKSIIKRNADRSTLPTVPAQREEDILVAAGSSGSVRSLSGKAIRIADEKLVFEYDGEERTVPMSRVVAIYFASSKHTIGGLPEEPILRVCPAGVHRIPARVVRNPSPSRFTFAAIGFDDVENLAPGGFRTWTTNEEPLRSIDVYAGRSVELNSLVYQRQSTPLFDLDPPFAVNEFPDGSDLKVGSSLFEHGFALGPRTSLTFQTGGTFARLETVACLAPGAGGVASLQILGDGDLLYERQDLDAAAGQVEIACDIAGRNEVEITVGYGSQFDVDNVVVIGEPMLLRQRSSALSAAAAGAVK